MPVDAPLPCKKRQKKHDRRFRKNYKDDLRVEYSVIPEATGPAAGDKVGPPNPESVQVKDVQAVEGIPAKNEIRDELIRELVRHVGLHHTK